MVTRAFPALLLCFGCFGSHQLGSEPTDASLDASPFDSSLDGPDTTSPDASWRPDGGWDIDAGTPSELTFGVPAHRLHGARWGESTSLVVSFEARAERPIEIWTFDRVSAELPSEAQVLRDTAGANAGAAARWGDLVAVAVEQLSGPHEVIVYDIRSDRPVARWVPDPTLMRPRVLHTYVALDETRLLIIWLDLESIIRYQLVSFGGEVRELAAGLAGTNSLSAAVRLAADEPVVSDVLRNRLGAAFDSVEERPERPWVADGASVGGSSVASYDRRSLYIDGEMRSDDIPEFTVMYGHMSYARSVDVGLAVMATGSGLFAGSIDADGVTWTTVEARFPAGSPVAHVNGTERGFFIVEGAIGFLPSQLRWIGL